MEMICLVSAFVFLFAGVLCMAVGVIGMYRFRFVLNRMHAAAVTDTFGLLLCMIGLIIWKGICFEALKMLVIVVFFWISGPVSSHLIARMEVSTNKELEKDCEVKEHGQF